MKKLLLASFFIFPISFLNAQAYDSLNSNNITAAFNADGIMFSANASPFNHIISPGNGISYSIANLWIGGYDQHGDLHVSAQTYRQSGTDFWPGALDTNSVSCTSIQSNHYNRLWKLNCSEVDSFVSYLQGQGGPGYSVPMDIQTWPGNGQVSAGEEQYLAPFIDADADGYYNWTAGDYPIARGDQSLFYVYNDSLVGNTHTESQGKSLGMEIEAMPYEFNRPWDDALMNTVFIHYTIVNHSQEIYDSTRIGFWSDFDLGNSAMNRVGSDSILSASYHYSQNDAVGIIFLNTPMNNTIAYGNNFGFTGNPSTSDDYYDYLKGRWKDGSHLTFGSNGYGGSVSSNWMFSGDPVSNSGWNDVGGGDRRVIGSTNDFILQPILRYTFDVAMVVVHDTGSNFACVQTLKQRMQVIKNFYATESQFCVPGITSIHETSINSPSNSVFPIPANTQITLQTSNEQPQQFTIYSVAGTKVMEGKTNGISTQLDIHQLPLGMYFIQVAGDHSNQMLKFIKSGD
ncbi:hypothetical protein BH09BAC5_BH09BAC5_22930 [soil metagenome]